MNLSKNSLSWLEKNSHTLANNKRGIERETLRINQDFTLSQKKHPIELGSALKNPLITTDFAENLLEFVSPALKSIDHLFDGMEDIHKYTYSNIGDEILWPLSFPCFIDDENAIPIADYGSSNQGMFKSVYREGLKNRYSAMMQTIAGIHYNFSFSYEYWQAKFSDNSNVIDKNFISNRYLSIIRNYYRYGWVIPYLFGASPALCKSFLVNRKHKIDIDYIDSNQGYIYLENATSLRLSKIGYSNDNKRDLEILFNNLDSYINKLKLTANTKDEEFAKIGLKYADGSYKQLNTNQLQIVNEYYAPIRPKRVVSGDQSMLDEMSAHGIEYLEIRSIDLNPYSSIGFSKDQAKFLELFLIWCELTESNDFTSEELTNCTQNWQKIILNGQDQEQQLIFNNQPKNAISILNTMLHDFYAIAEILDKTNSVNNKYITACDLFKNNLSQVTKTLPTKVLSDILNNGFKNFGFMQAAKFKNYFTATPYKIYSEQFFRDLAKKSLQEQLVTIAE